MKKKFQDEFSKCPSDVHRLYRTAQQASTPLVLSDSESGTFNNAPFFKAMMAWDTLLGNATKKFAKDEFLPLKTHEEEDDVIKFVASPSRAAAAAEETHFDTADDTVTNRPTEKRSSHVLSSTAIITTTLGSPPTQQRPTKRRRSSSSTAPMRMCVPSDEDDTSDEGEEGVAESVESEAESMSE